MVRLSLELSFQIKKIKHCKFHLFRFLNNLTLNKLQIWSFVMSKLHLYDAWKSNSWNVSISMCAYCQWCLWILWHLYICQIQLSQFDICAMAASSLQQQENSCWCWHSRRNKLIKEIVFWQLLKSFEQMTRQWSKLKGLLEQKCIFLIWLYFKPNNIFPQSIAIWI